MRARALITIEIYRAVQMKYKYVFRQYYLHSNGDRIAEGQKSVARLFNLKVLPLL